MTEQRMSTIYYLEMLAPHQLRPKTCPDSAYAVRECTLKQGAFNQFMYRLVGEHWEWGELAKWSSEQWRDYAERESLRTWGLYQDGAPIGYFELEKQADDAVEIRYFGVVPAVMGRGLGGYLLTEALQAAWGWGASRVWVHTCTEDHLGALANYQARGMLQYKAEIIPI